MRIAILLVLVGLVPPLAAQIPLQPYTINWTRASESIVDLSRLLDAPADKKGFLRVKGDHIVKPDGARFRFWGVNICGANCFPTHDEAVLIAGDLARMGINVVRFHHLDSPWGHAIFDSGRNDTRHLDPEALERLDFFIAEMKKRGIYANLNLNVSRSYRGGDGVRDYKFLGIGKSATYFNPRLIELQHEYARQLLTHRNAYTGKEYRHEPCVALVEMVNENSVLEGWVSGRLIGRDSTTVEPWSPIPLSYAQELTDQYNAWLETNLPPAMLAGLRREAGAADHAPVPRLTPVEFSRASRERFHAEARFYLALERTFFEGMRKLLKDELGVQCMMVGTADHNDSYSGYAHIQANLVFDYVDSHGYWEHPNVRQGSIKNTPMVNDPLDSTVVQFARSPVAGLPFTISEVNNPYPHEYACEGFPILTAYALFYDWDGIYWFDFGKGRRAGPEQGFVKGGWFDFSNDPVKMATLYACALMWHRHDLEAARKTIRRSYNAEHLVESLRMDRKKDRPFFTAGFSLSTPLEHATRFDFKGAKVPSFPPAAPLGRLQSDTGQLCWFDADQKKGLVTVDSPCTQALVGFVRAGGKSVHHLSADVQNEFCSLVLTSLDGMPVAKARRLLLVAGSRVTNTGFQWKEDHKTVSDWGKGPMLIEPVTGRVTLRDLGQVKSLRALPLAGEGRALDRELPCEKSRGDWHIALGQPATAWCVLEVER